MVQPRSQADLPSASSLLPPVTHKRLAWNIICLLVLAGCGPHRTANRAPANELDRRIEALSATFKRKQGQPRLAEWKSLRSLLVTKLALERTPHGSDIDAFLKRYLGKPTRDGGVGMEYDLGVINGRRHVLGLEYEYGPTIGSCVWKE
jgi:hypothetical protein